ncbi:MAG TPA: hypothetical protein VGM07_02300 [Stellaceae bacterium]
MIGLAWAALPTLSILGYAFGLRQRLRLPLALCLPPSIALVVLLLMAGSLAAILYDAWLLTLFAGLILLAWRGLPALRLGAWRDPAFGLFLAAALGLYLYVKPCNLILWDEFSNWGAFSKFLLQTDRLPRVLGEVILIDYPPGLGLFSYFISRGFGFDEGFLLFASALLQAAMLLSFLATLRWRDLPTGVLLAAALISIGSAFGIEGYSWTTVTADNPLACVTAAALVIYLAGGREPGALTASGLVLALACSIKDSGNLIAAAMGVAMLLDQLLTAWREEAPVNAKWLARRLAALALPSLGVIVAWRLHTAELHQPAAFATGLEVLRQRLAAPGFAHYARSIAGDYWAALLGARPIGNLGVGLPGWLAILGLLALNAIVLRRRHRQVAGVIVLNGVLLAGFAVYAAALLYFYLFSFVPYEARRPAGMERYLSAYLLMWLLAAMAMLIWQGTNWGARLSVAGWSGLALIVAGPSFWSAASIGPRGGPFAAGVEQARQMVRSALGGSIAEIPSNASVYVLWNGTTGLPYYITQFELKPRRTSYPRFISMSNGERFTDPSLWCHSLGPPRFAGDVWSCDWTLATFVKALRGYDFLFVGAADAAFVARYGSLFPDGSLQSGHTMFRIRRAGATLAMEPVGPDTVAPMRTMHGAVD